MAGDSGGVLSRLAVVVAVRGLDGVGQLGASEIPRAHQIPTPAPSRHIHLGLVPRQSFLFSSRTVGRAHNEEP